MSKKTKNKPSEDAQTPVADDKANTDESVSIDAEPATAEAPAEAQANEGVVTEQQPELTAQTSGKTKILIPTIIAIAAVGFCFYLLQQQQKLLLQLDTQHVDLSGYATTSSIDGIKAEQEQLQLAVYSQLAEVDKQTKQFNARLKLPEQNIVRLEQEIDRINAEIKITQSQLSHLPTSFSDAELSWLLARVEFLLATANDILVLEGDVASAAQGLTAAESLLRKAGKPALLPLREAIRNDIDLLNAVPKVDQANIINTLNTLIHDTSALSLEEVPTRWPLKAAPIEEDISSAAESAGYKLLSAVKGIIDVRRGKRGQALLLSPDAHFVLVQNMAMQLETAKAALLTRNQAQYSASLNDTRAWIATHFNESDTHVSKTVSTIANLQKIDISPLLPGLEQSQSALEKTQTALTDKQLAAGG